MPFIKPPWPDEDLAILKREIEAGSSYGRVAEMLGRTRSMVSGKVRVLREANLITVPKVVDRDTSLTARKPRLPKLEEPEPPKAPVSPPAEPKGRVPHDVIAKLRSGALAVPDAPSAPQLSFNEMAELKTSDRRCLYIYGDANDGRVFRGEPIYCGSEVMRGSVYCPAHTRLCYTTPGAKKREQNDG